MLAVEDVRLVYNRRSPTEVVALDGLRLHLDSGQFATVVGANGAGKSSLVGIVAGAVRPTAGRVLIAGKDVTALPDYRRARRIARVFDNPHAGTVPSLSIEDNLALALDRGRRRGLRFAVTARRRAQLRDALAQLELGLEHRLADPVALLSAGQRQSLTLVMAGLQRPEILLLDEHLAALDPGTQRRVLQLTLDLIGDLGCTALMITHNMQHAIELGDRLIVMSRGRVIADYCGVAKQSLTIERLVGDITHHGGVVSDRSLLVDGESVPAPS